ncbi:MAG: tetratricopeptide repeat protein [Candidatus Latescibacterota bacterium]|nr:tetratricopeptide repeat protein [Candidatus Latescibacterota bacterium]
MSKAGGFGLPAFLSALVMDRDYGIALCALALALGLAYGASFGNGFHYDDVHSIVENPHIRSLARIATFFTDPSTFSSMPERAMYRPVLLVTLALNYAWGAYEVVGYHVVNWLLHLGCAMLVYALGRALHGKRRAALVGALLFALHPLNAEAVNYISSRSESLAALFYLAALFCYIRWRQQGMGYCWLLSLMAFACAVLSKSVAVVLPVALVAYERWGRGRTSVVAGGLWLYHAAYWALVGAYLLLARNWLGNSLEKPVRGLGEQLATQAKAAIYYVQLIVAPTQLSVEHPFAVAHGWLDLPVVLALAGWAAAVWFALRRPQVLLVGCWLVLPLLPASLVPLNVLVNEHRLYLPLAFLGLGLGWMLRERLAGKHRVLVVVLLVVSAAMTYDRSRVWQDELSLWADAARKAPGMYRAHLHLGGALEGEGRVAEALLRYERAAELAPGVAEVHYNRGNALVALNREADAGVAYKLSLELNPRFLPTLVNLAVLYQAGGQLAAADTLLQAVVAAHPENAEARRRLGVLRKRQGRGEEAAALYARALELDPDLAEARYNLGNHHSDLGRHEAAIAQYQWAIRIEPEHAGAYRNLGELHLERGQFQAAVAIWSQGLQVLPGEVIFYYGLGRALEAQGQVAAAVQNYRRFLHRGSLNAQQAVGLQSRIRELEARLR